MSKYYILCLSLMAAGVLMSGCTNTFNGAGEDVENMGEWMQDTF